MKESFEEMALRVAKEKFGEDAVLQECLEYATRIRDELCKGQEPVGYVYTDLTTLKATKNAAINADIPNGTPVFLHPRSYPC
jgi:hypothetical protein